MYAVEPMRLLIRASVLVLLGHFVPTCPAKHCDSGVRFESRKTTRLQLWQMTDAPWTIAPTTSLDFAASPVVTSPAELVARFGLDALPTIAGIVQVRRILETKVARIGGRHGP